ncbi:MAG: transketolase [Coriobacteriales bacterium]|nr:transketolase [Coriobacteriales bacterium]
MAFDEQAVRLRACRIRKSIIEMIGAAGSGHPGGSLSAADILATLYFGDVLRYDADRPDWPDRDRFILSKGHAAPVLYATLAEMGLIPHDELLTLRRLGSRLQGHPDSRKLPGVEVSTGSLGQGLSIAAGLALGLGSAEAGAAAGGFVPAEAGAGLGEAASGTPVAPQPPTVYVLLGDGELQEGQVWEAAMFAAHRRLNNLVAIIDNNGLQIDGRLEEVVGLGSIEAKFKAFNWQVLQADGHDIAALKAAFTSTAKLQAGPVVIIAKTVKGKGVNFMEGQCGWHGKAPSVEQCAQALSGLADGDE